MVAGTLATSACDGGVQAVDASMPPAARTSDVSLRLDVPSGKPASLTVLAFGAAFSGMAAADVLGLVDPLAASAPGRDCQVRDVGQSAAALVARGDGIELEELAGVTVSLGGIPTEIHPSPRLYPDLAATIGGVVSEAGPFSMASVPELVRIQRGGIVAGPAESSADVATVSVPPTAWVTLLNGITTRDGVLIDAGADLNLNVATGTVPGTRADPAAVDLETSVELRPFGATVALACAIPSAAFLVAAGGGPSTVFMVPRQALNALVSLSGATTPGAAVAASLDIVRRSHQRLPVSSTRISVEVRTSTFVELRP